FTGARHHWETAASTLSEALERRPEHAPGSRLRAITYYHLGRVGDALADLELTLKQDPHDIDAHGWHAVVLFALSRDPEALSAANAALAEIAGQTEGGDDRRGWLLAIKGRSLLNTKWRDEGIKILEDAANLAPRNEDIARHLISGYKARDDWKSV